MDQAEAVEPQEQDIMASQYTSRDEPAYPDSCYEYQSLPDDHFRLLRFVSQGPYLECDLENYSVSAPPRYFPISHAWTEEKAEEIIICGQHHLVVSYDIHEMLGYIYEYLQRNEKEEDGYYICESPKALSK